MRPWPLPSRSARTLTARRPVIWTSGSPGWGSLLVIVVTRQLGALLQLSVATTLMLTGRILLFGGVSTLGDACTAVMLGGV